MEYLLELIQTALPFLLFALGLTAGYYMGKEDEREEYESEL